jgi:N-acetylmuramoyl-L-alanine amidase
LSFLNKDRIVASHKLGIDISHGIYRDLKKIGYPIHRIKVRGGPFWVLVGTQMPAVLIEVGYLTNPTESRRLKNPRYQWGIAKGIADGIDSYFRKNP